MLCAVCGDKLQESSSRGTRSPRTDSVIALCLCRGCDGDTFRKERSAPAATAMVGLSKGDRLFVVIHGGKCEEAGCARRRSRPTTGRLYFAVHKPDPSSGNSRPDRFTQGCHGPVEELEWPQKRVQAPLEKRVASPHILLSFTRVKVIPHSHLQHVPEPRGSGPGHPARGAPVS